MKKYFILSLLIAFSLPLCAQHDNGNPNINANKRPKKETDVRDVIHNTMNHHDRKHKEVTEIVGNLSAAQKRKVENISNESRERVAALRKQQHAVHDSIVMFMEREGDQSQVLYPLFEREAKLQTAINREMYATKLRIDEVLKPEQREALRAASRKHKANPKQ